jgi:hypothetical protein
MKTKPSKPLFQNLAKIKQCGYEMPCLYQLQNGQQLDPIFNNGVKQNAYAPGVGQDQFGRPVYNSPP